MELLSDEERVYGRALRFVSIRPRSQKEIRFWFKRKRIASGVVQRVFNQLERAGFVDDKAFASWWVEQRLAFRPKALRLIKLELLSKGVAREIIDEVLAISDVPSELETARELVKKFEGRLGNLGPKKRKEKLIANLSRRGFGWEVIRKLVDLDKQ